MNLLHPQENTCFIVPNLKNETVKQNQKNRNNERNTSETSSLKALALKVLERNNTRNKSETKPINEVKQDTLKSDLLFHPKNDPIREEIFCLKGTRGQWISKQACISCKDMPHYCYYPYVFNPHDPQREILPYKKRSSMSKGA